MNYWRKYMPQLLETLKIQNNQAQLIDFHNQRLNTARKQIFGCKNFIDINDYINLPKDYQNNNQIIKCRVIYSVDIENITFEVYNKRAIKKLKLISVDDIDYSFKYLDRAIFDKLLKDNNIDTKIEDIIIVKNGLLTDTSFSNIVLFDGEKFFTPKTPLLNGVKRQYLITQKKIVPINISINDLHKFKQIHLINALLDLNDICININNNELSMI